MKKKIKRKQIFDKKGVEELGKRLKVVRNEKKLPQRQLAYEAGISHSQVARIEQGLINPSVSTMFAIAKALEVPVSYLFEFEHK